MKDIEYYTFHYTIPVYKIKTPKDFCEYYQTHKDEIIVDLDKKNKKLNNIIDELEKYIKEEIIEGNKKPEDYKRYGLEDYVKGQLTAYVNTLNKLKKLKENK